MWRWWKPWPWWPACPPGTDEKRIKVEMTVKVKRQGAEEKVKTIRREEMWSWRKLWPWCMACMPTRYLWKSLKVKITVKVKWPWRWSNMELRRRWRYYEGDDAGEGEGKHTYVDPYAHNSKTHLVGCEGASGPRTVRCRESCSTPKWAKGFLKWTKEKSKCFSFFPF